MIDFMTISTRTTKSGGVEIYPKFIIKRSTDLMIRGGDFYAIWLEERGMWSTDEQDALDLIDKELDKYVKEYQEKYGGSPRAMLIPAWSINGTSIARFSYEITTICSMSN